MPLINCKLKAKCKCCVLAAAGVDNTNANPNNTIFTIKDTKLYVHRAPLSAEDNLKLSKLLSKGFEDQCIGMNIKQKVSIKIRQIGIDIFSNHTL